jgi:Divergent InlB B-repeat domain
MNKISKFVFVATTVAAATTSALRADSALQDKERKTDSAPTSISAPSDEPIASASSESAKSSLTVVNGNPSGNYPPGALILVTADVPPAGAKFAGWTGDVAILANPLLPTTTVTIPHMAVSITATYTAPESQSGSSQGGSWMG